MQQVLFFIPLQTIASYLPDVGWVVYAALGMLTVGVGSWLEKRRREQGGRGGFNVQFVSVPLGVLLLLAAAVVFFAPTTAEVPIYGYGTMLFVAFLACTWVAAWLAAREGVEPTHVQDVAIWIFLMGIIGARLTFMFLAAPNQ